MKLAIALNYTNLCFILFILGIIIVLLIKSNAKDESLIHLV